MMNSVSKIKGLNALTRYRDSTIGVADFRYEFFLKGARRAPFKKNSYPDPPMPHNKPSSSKGEKTR